MLSQVTHIDAKITIPIPGISSSWDYPEKTKIK